MPLEIAVAMLERQEQWLLQLRDDIPGIVHPGTWGLFGGHLDPGETPEQAAIRELQEELCITPTDISRVGRLMFAFVDGYHLEAWVFRAEGMIGEPTPGPEAIPFWNSVHTIPFERMWADDKEWFPHLIQRVPFEGRFVFDGDTMLGGDVVAPVSEGQ